jgi:hypothetical protein
MPEADESLPGPIDRSPDLRRLSERRAKYRGLRRTIFDRLVVPAEIPDEFNGPLAELRDSLETTDVKTAETVLSEAQAYFDEAEARIEGAERRATALQATVAIAASLVVGGAALLLDDDKVADDTWRAVLVIVLGVFVVCLIACAWRALTVTTRMFEFEQPGTERIPARAQLPENRALTFRAAELLRAGSVASEVGAVKVGLLRAAAWWLRNALLVLAAFVGLLAAYVIGDSESSDSEPKPRTKTVERTVTVTVPAPQSPPKPRPERKGDRTR